MGTNEILDFIEPHRRRNRYLTSVGDDFYFRLHSTSNVGCVSVCLSANESELAS